MEKKGWKITAIILFILLIMFSIFLVYILKAFSVNWESQNELICERDCFNLDYEQAAMNDKQTLCMCQTPEEKEQPYRVYIDNSGQVYDTEGNLLRYKEN